MDESPHTRSRRVSPLKETSAEASQATGHVMVFSGIQLFTHIIREQGSGFSDQFPLLIRRKLLISTLVSPDCPVTAPWALMRMQY